MLPTSIVGLALLIFSLTPGFVFIQRREQFHAGRKYSALRETSMVVVTSLVADVFALLAFGFASRWIDGSRTAVNALFNEGTGWVKHNYRSTLVCGSAILAVACLIGFIAASPFAWIPGMNTGWGTRWRGTRQRVSSAWTVAFSTNNLKGSPVVVGVELQNGTHLRGVLDHWSTDLDDHSDRSFLLTRPLAIRVSDKFVPLEAHYLEVSASQLRYMTATYVDRAVIAPNPGSPPLAATVPAAVPDLPSDPAVDDPGVV